MEKYIIYRNNTYNNTKKRKIRLQKNRFFFLPRDTKKISSKNIFYFGNANLTKNHPYVVASNMGI